MTTNEFIYAIREKLRAHTDDTKYTNDYLVYLANLKRNFYIRREYNQTQRTIDSDLLQTICLELEHVDESECPQCFLVEGCEVIRTKKKVPNAIELHNRNVITRIAPVGVSNRAFSIVSRARWVYVGGGKYDDTLVFAMLHDNGHIYLKSKAKAFRSLEYISTTMLFENPDEGNNYMCGDKPCYNADTDKYPIKAWMVDIIISDIVKELANLEQLPVDVTNDADDNRVK